jgi:ribokinase
MKNLWVVGSINMDLVAESPRFVEPGETLTGLSFREYPGGKGANQAVALARLGARPRMVGCVGDDDYGRRYLKVFEQEGVEVSAVTVAGETSTGLALIEVAGSGENRILLIPGANATVQPAHVDSILGDVKAGDLALLQLELPLTTVAYAIAELKRRGVVIILDPAPAVPLDAKLLAQVDYLTPNETEARLLGAATGAPQSGLEAAQALQRQGVGTVILKAGSRGSFVVGRESVTPVAPFRVQAIDTTAAGDSFNAGFAFSLAQGTSVSEAARFANAVAALSTTAKGAQGAMPDFAAVSKFMGSSASNA